MLNKMFMWSALIVAQLAASNSYAAGLFRTYLSVEGNDSNACTVSAPCRLLPAALAATQSGGEVWILDSANYNVSAVAITQSVSILAVPGALGSVVGSGSDAVDIGGTSGISVTFRNLVFREIDNTDTYVGVNVSNPNASVVVENGEFALFSYGFEASAWKQIDISDSTFYGTTNAGIYLNGATAVSMSPTLSSVTIDHCHLRENLNTAVTAINAAVALSHNTISNNPTGIFIGDGSNVLLDSNSVVGNSNAGVAYVSSGIVGAGFTLGNNGIASNGVNVNGGTLTAVSQQ